MSYFGFLARFLLIPIFLLIGGHLWLNRMGRKQPTHLNNFSPLLILLLHIVIAVIYTTPWDNYLVATKVWWYNPELVTGILFGYVPIEEYTFFVLQPIMTGLWLWGLMRLIAQRDDSARFQPRANSIPAMMVTIIWVISLIGLFSGWQPAKYFSITLAWAMIPIGIQTFFGADILWHHRKLIFWGIVPPTIYLGWADSLAITATTWTINPLQSTQWMIGPLPIEELFFFFITNTLIVVGMTLALAKESEDRLQSWRNRFFR